ncbi:hypothetical protein GGS23DRAFT_560508 [Durotheca rogersii]|uniref:uncharacterized protein n=1 Tax=Durotheca rogersii TaxID=419775 RepID=UPI00221F9CE9|nr:uncharacterized protein GGS23DRAFT_560508 [Durotheca rogersii]KAI5864507.1 hypothetical protein GGS23DRAFT_560508 [Durotheca rogersii]
MKRKTAEEAGSLGLPEPKRGRSEDSSPIHDDYNYESSQAEDDLSDEESQYAPTIPAAANHTPLTPLSPSRKFPSDLKTIRCTFPDCLKTFNRPARLAAHLRSHNKERPFKCTVPGCDKDYIEEKHLRQHIKGSHTSVRDHICTQPNCGKSFMTATRLRRHQAVHEGEERFRCRDYPPCDQSFRKHQTLQRHIRSEHLRLAPFPCDFKQGASGTPCGEGFDSAGALRRHQEREHGELRFWCEECNPHQNGSNQQQQRVGFATMVQLQAHIKQAHVNCMFCGLVCDGRAGLEQHIESQHANPQRQSLEERKTVRCTWPGCTKMFTKKSNLNMHVRSFHNCLRFVCGEVDLGGTADLVLWQQSEGCGESFSTKASLENHVRYVHMKLERPGQVQGASPKPRPAPDVMRDLTGVGEKSRRTLACTMSGCKAKFVHGGELEAHLRSQHTVEQALLEQVGAAPVPDPMLPELPAEFDAMIPATTATTTGWEGSYGDNGEFWIGADTAGTGALGAAGPGDDEEEWTRDEAEMKQLIEPNELEGLIDPALTGFQ